MEWKVKYVDLQKSYQDREGEIDNAIKRTMMNGAFILRDDVRIFEENVASFLGAEYAVGVNSGTDALYLACKVAGLSEGDEVITVGHTFVATVAAIHHCQATPILVDIADAKRFSFFVISPPNSPILAFLASLLSSLASFIFFLALSNAVEGPLPSRYFTSDSKR